VQFRATHATKKQQQKHSNRTLTQTKVQGASQAMLYATGLTEEDMGKAQVGICSVWYEGNPCNMHLLDLSEKVKHGVQQTSQLVGFRFNTVGVSDGISMGTSGMRYSLQSRDLIADSMETTMGGQWYDGLIAIPGCDKNMPGCIMAMGRLNRPGIMIYGGTIRAGKAPSTGNSVDIVSAFQAYGEYVYDRITDEERKEILQHACPGPGACGGMYTANTMATAIEALGTLATHPILSHNALSCLIRFVPLCALTYLMCFCFCRYVAPQLVVFPRRLSRKGGRV
jgi:dihydroxy-acid dehydratase